MVMPRCFCIVLALLFLLLMVKLVRGIWGVVEILVVELLLQCTVVIKGW